MTKETPHTLSASRLSDGLGIDLLPCPFCGYEKIFYTPSVSDDDYYAFVMCNGCGARVCNSDSLPEGDCVSVWNNRTMPPNAKSTRLADGVIQYEVSSARSEFGEG